MGEILYGNTLAMELRGKLKEEILERHAQGIPKPCLAVVLVGNDVGSMSYVRGIQKQCANTEIEARLIQLEETITQDELNEEIRKLSNNDEVDGIIIQVPLPKGLDILKAVHYMDPKKDMDGAHRENVASLYLKTPGYVPCTPEGILTILKSTGIDFTGKEAVVIGRSNSVGRPIAQILLNENATVTICHSKTVALKELTQRADILIVAVGRAKFVKADMVKEGAIVVDVGVNSDENGKLCGDTDFDAILPKCRYITPVTKGVGSLTTAALMTHVIKSWRERHGV